MGKIKMEAKIVRQDEIATDIYSMVIQAPEIASQAVPGQFIDVYSADGSKLLPRPISLCEIDRAAGTLRIVYRIAGKGTKEFSMLTSDHTITILGPLGNGFTKKDKKAILIGGGIGVKGTVMDAIRQCGIEGTEIYACGPTPMLRAIQSYALEHGIEAQLSLEERMACGVGACLACVCKSKEIDDHSQVKNKRVCKDGPVFYAEEVEL